MRKLSVTGYQLTVFAMLFALCPLRGPAATNVNLNFTWQQINSNIATVAESSANWDLAYGWGNHTLAGYATGTPLYVESDPVWTAASSSVWSAIGTAAGSVVSVNGQTGTVVLTAASLGAVTSESDPVWTAASNGVQSSIANLQSSISSVSNAAVQRIVLNGTTNTPTSGTVNLGTISGGGSVTNVEVFTPNMIRLLSVTPSVASAGTAAANGAYADSGTTADGKPVYTNAACKIRFHTLTGKWQIENSAGSTTYYYQSTAQSVPWSGRWSTAAGTAPAPTVTAANNTVADIEEVAASAAQSVKTIILNGVTNAPVDGVVDLGTIESGGGAVTNVEVFMPNGVSVWMVETNTLVDSFIASGAGYPDANGLYTQLTSELYTNATTGAYLQYFAGPPGTEAWFLYHNEYDRYSVTTTSTTPWLESGWTDSWGGSILPVPTFSTSSVETNQLASLTNSLQRVTEPSASTDSGRAGQTSISADTNQFFYWFSPTAVSGTTTGIWLRVEGSAF